MRPTWARKFEPPSVSSDETQESVEALILLSQELKDASLLRPIQPALSYLRRSRLPDGRLARFYEIGSNRPMYMTRNGNAYEITFDDSQLPSHYGWKIADRTGELSTRLSTLRKGPTPTRRTRSMPFLNKVQQNDAERVLASLDDKQLWVSRFRTLD